MSTSDTGLSATGMQLASFGVVLLILPFAILSWVTPGGDVTPEAFVMRAFSLVCFGFVGFAVKRILSSLRRANAPVVPRRSQSLADRMAVLVFAAPFLPLGLIVLSNLADGNYRYLPDWAPVWAAWCFEIVAACLGASALWTGLKSGD